MTCSALRLREGVLLATWKWVRREGSLWQVFGVAQVKDRAQTPGSGDRASGQL